MNLLEGKLLAEGQRIGIVAGRFNEFITSKLLGGALDPDQKWCALHTSHSPEVP